MKSNKNSLESQLALVSAPEDFPAQLRSLSSLDSTLRCPVCKEFYQAPVLIHIPKCCHTFCSACIRSCFNNDSNNQKIRATGLGGVGNSHRCPICKVEAQEEKIKPVPTLESAVICWQDAREEILNIIRRLQSFESQSNQKQHQQQPDEVYHPSIIPHPTPSSSKNTLNRPQTRSTRANSHTLIQSSQEAASQEQNSTLPRNRLASKNSRTHPTLPPKKRKLTAGSSVEQQDSGDDIQLLSYNPTDPSAPVECPLCRRKMLNSNMDQHITQCLNEQEKSQTRPSLMFSKRSEKRAQNRSNKDQGQEGTKPTQNRITLPHFSSLKTKEIRAELTRHGLNPAGTPSDQMRRLSKYITLFNANLDAQLVHQKSIESIKSQVYLWENLQDTENLKLEHQHKKLLHNQKDYLKLNKSHFDLLIDQASKSLNKSCSNTSHPSKPAALEGDHLHQQPQEEQDKFLNADDHIDQNLLTQAASTDPKTPPNNGDVLLECSDLMGDDTEINQNLPAEVGSPDSKITTHNDDDVPTP